MLTLQAILLQIDHPIWYYNAFFYLFVASIVFFTFISFAFVKSLRRKTIEMKSMQEQHVARVDLIRKDHGETLEKIRIEMLKREEERTRQWMESEKETLHVLNGVSILLDLNEKIEKNDSVKILNKLDEIRDKIEKITPKD